MATSSQPRLTLAVLHYSAPFLAFSVYAIASLWAICTLQTAPSALSKTPKVAILSLLLVATSTYVAESVVIITQIFAGQGAFASQDSNVYALSGVLVASVLSASIYESDHHQWYPYWGAWTLMLSADLIISNLNLMLAWPRSPLELVQVALPLLRVSVLAILLVLSLSFSRKQVEVKDEETPLLPKDSPAPGQQHVGAIGSEEDTVTASADEEDSKREKKEKEQLARLHARLSEDGNWLKYASGFSIFFPYIWPTKRPLLLVNMCGVALCLLGERALNILVPRQLGFLVNFLYAGNSHESFVALGLYILFEWLNSYSGIRAVRSSLWIPVESNARESLDTASYNHIMELSCDFHDEKQQGELFTAMRQGGSLVNLLETLLYDLLPVILDLVLALGYFYLLFDSYLVLIGAATMVVYFWVSITITAIQVRLQRKNNASVRKKYQYLNDSMGDWKTVSYFNQIPHAERMYAASVSLTQSIWRQLSRIMYISHGVQGLVLDLGSFGAFFFAVYQVVYKGKSVGSFMTLLTYWSSFTGPLMDLASTHKHLLDDLVDAEELLSLFRKKPSVEDGPNEMDVTNAEIVFDGVKFMYNGKKDIIDDFSLKVESGKTVALIGETGAGKSTILKLLFRFYDVSEGSIKIDGQDIRNVTLESLRRSIGVVPQDSSLFNDTIIANLRYAKLDATEEQIYEACKAAAIHEQILSFTDGYQSVVGERGVRLSGGELQRIAIARAILKDPKIILLDEATSSVDNETEEKIQAGLNRLCKGRTTFVIAHRLSTVLDADQIIVMKSGIILEQGTPAELLRRKGKYYSLWSKQMGIVDVMAKHQASEALGADQAASEPLITIDSDETGQSGDSYVKTGNGDETLPKDFSGNGQTAPSLRSHRAFRPEAPEFVPGSQVTDGQLMDTEASQQLATIPTNWQEAMDDNKGKAHKRKVQRRKTRVQASPNLKLEGSTTADEKSAMEGTDMKAPPESQKHRASQRRKPSRSGAGDPDHGPHDADITNAENAKSAENAENEPPPAASSKRRVSAPTGLPLRHGSYRAFNHSERLRRQGNNNWRARNSSTNSESATATTSTQPSGDWSSEGGESSSQPTPPPLPTPTEEGGGTTVMMTANTTAAGKGEGDSSSALSKQPKQPVVAAGTLRFVPGSRK